jgi:CDP-diacylglycerol--serine O-phosphatidyltransferase
VSDLSPSETPAARQPRRAAFVLPSLFTAGNIFLGFLALLRTIQAAMAYSTNPQLSAEQFAFAAKVIGISILLDGLDGRVARMTNTASAFGAELDSLADVISFGIAPAVLAYFWGVHFVNTNSSPIAQERSCSSSVAQPASPASTSRRTPNSRIPAGPTVSTSRV